ncbi:MAG: hypothetical protein AAF762_10525, partial [Pseudomonadota bacterium]
QTTIAALFIAFSAGAQPLSDLQSAAEAALVGGRPAEAAEAADRILAAQPGTYAALFVKSAALADLGQFTRAAEVAAEAHAAARTDPQRVSAAQLAASARFQAGHYTRAEWWLRRAANRASTSEEAAQIRVAFRAVRRENPLSVQLSFNAVPTSNFNGGSAGDTIDFEGLGTLDLAPERQALSGIEFSGDIRLGYRLSSDDVQTTRVEAYLYGRTYRPSDSAKRDVPGIDGDDYALGVGELSLSHRRLIFKDVGPTGVSVLAGQLHYGGQAYYNYRRLSLSQDVARPRGRTLSFFASREWQRGIEERYDDAEITRFATSWRTPRENGDTLRLTFEVELHDTDTFEASFEEYTVSGDYTFREPFLGINWSASLGVGHTNYDAFFLSLDGRRDEFVFTRASARWSNIAFFGFSPQLTLTARRRVSDVSSYTASTWTLNFGLVSLL